MYHTGERRADTLVFGAVAAEDFDGDRRSDVAVALGGSSVWIFDGRGDGTLGPPVGLAAPSVRSIASADLDRDGIKDLVGCNSDTGLVYLFPGSPSGGFGPRRDLRVPAGGIAIAAGRIDGDATADLVVALPSRNSVAVLLGSEGYRRAVEYPVGTRPMALCLGDVNRDHRLDIVTANYGDAPEYQSHVAVLLGRGDGTFSPATEYPSGSGSLALVMGDWNEDGIQDLAVCDVNPNAPEPGRVAILIGSATGGFATSTAYGVGRSPSSIALLDGNHDGHLDLAVASFLTNTVTILRGTGSGDFRGEGPYRVGAHPVGVTTAHLDGDSDTDLICAIPEDPGVSVALGNADGSYGQSTLIHTGLYPRAVAAGDVNGDGLPDLLSISASYSPNPDSLYLNLATGARTYAPALGFPVGSGATSLRVADVNHDSHLDALVSLYAYTPGVTDSGTIAVLLGDGTGGFRAGTQWPVGFQPYGVVVADFDHDGNPDLATANAGSSTVSVLMGNGDGTFRQAQHYVVGRNPRYIEQGDVDEDGYQDLLTVTAQELVVLRNNRDGTFAVSVIPLTEPNAALARVGDWNGDGHLDVAIPTFRYEDALTIYLGNGTGSFRFKADVSAGLGSSFTLGTADVDGDGVPDLLAGEASEDVAVYRGRGDGTFEPRVGFGTGDAPYDLAIADLDRDGRVDVVAANINTGSVSVLWNAGLSPESPPLSSDQLLQNRPNPFNPVTTISYSLASPGVIAIRVYDVQGRLVRTLASGMRPAGPGLTQWDGRDESHRPIATGVYFCAITFPDGAIRSRKMTLLR